MPFCCIQIKLATIVVEYEIIKASTPCISNLDTESKVTNASVNDNYGQLNDFNGNQDVGKEMNRFFLAQMRWNQARGYVMFKLLRTMRTWKKKT